MAPMLKKMDQWEANIASRPGAFRGGENSPMRFDIIRSMLNLKDDHPPLPGFPRSLPHVIGSITNTAKSVRELDKNPLNGKKRMDPATIQELFTFARTVGADEIGFATVPQEWVFKQTAILHDRAIVLVMEMDKERMNMAPNKDTAAMVHETYNALGQVSNQVAGWLRERGFSAHAGHPLGGMALYPPMAQAAGLGWRGINGLLITPRFGPRIRLTAVFTEIENLPIYERDEYAWVLDYCDLCRRCIRDCPPEAIYETPIYNDNGLVTTVDNTKCFPYFANYHGCSICIKVCPFHHQSYESLKTTLNNNGG
jgi:NAD-dependent dihydropyrimidine dehydrogenase PreA subunit